MTGTLHDLVQLARELLAPTVVHPTTLERATAVAFPGLAGVLPGFGRQDPCDWGLGVEVRGTKHPHWTGSANSPSTFGHFGQSGSFLWVDPAAATALVVQTDRDFGPWAAEAWPAVSDGVLAEVAGWRSGRS
jgi:CubicO group peptidase (beta-lactamase class C family)